jgi:phosphotransferase system enzyme I (PtsP)
VAEDTEAERQRVYLAFDKMREQIDRMASQAEFGVGGEHEEVLETYKMFAYDEGWSRRINEAIDSGLTAEAAIERVQQRTRMRMRQIDDPLLADRMHDLEDWRTACCASSRASSARPPARGCAAIRS